MQQRNLALCVSTAFYFQAALAPLAGLAAASPVSFSDNSGVSGQVVCNKVGALLLADGIAVMNGDHIEVKEHHHDSNGGKTVLKGVLFKTMQTSVSGVSAISGYVYFQSGTSLDKIDPATCPESVDLTDGTSQSGPLSSVTADQIVCGSTTISMAQVRAVHSSKAFKYKMNVNGGGRLQLEPTCLKVTTSKVKREHFYKKHPYLTTLAVVAIGCGIACAIAIPIACSHHGSLPPNPPAQTQTTPVQTQPTPAPTPAPAPVRVQTQQVQTQQQPAFNQAVQQSIQQFGAG